MATTSTSARPSAVNVTNGKRARHFTGYYRALNELSTADFLGSVCNRDRDRGMHLSAAEYLPEGIYRVDRLVAKRRRKVMLMIVW